MSESGAIMIGLLIGCLIVIAVFGALYAYHKLETMIEAGIANERRTIKKYRDRSREKYETLELRVSDIEDYLMSEDEEA